MIKNGIPLKMDLKQIQELPHPLADHHDQKKNHGKAYYEGGFWLFPV